ncbi:MAG: hypothetical protein HYZ49_02335 [Chloroflexi bacterium]|nr:hypothetical protein [Chloroflexota bacterium]
MLIEITSPAILPLGIVHAEGRPGLLGLTLQHPPVQLFAQSFDGLKITGARADEARKHAERFYAHHKLEPHAEVEIELAIPNFVGLGSSAMLGLSLAQALAWIHKLNFEDKAGLAQLVGLERRHALEARAFEQGGLLLVAENGDVIRRGVIQHSNEQAWAFVFVFPKTPPGTQPALEAERLQALWEVGQHLNANATLNASLWSAVERDDIAAFASALMTIQELNRAALAGAGKTVTASPEDQALLNIMRQHGALAYGNNPAGTGLFGLIQGDTASIKLRKHLQDHIGFFGGTVMASIADNGGARHVVKDDTLYARSLRDT